MTTLRFVTYLAPSIPAEFYRALAELAARSLGVEVSLEVDARRSGPELDDDPFSNGRVDVGFLCAPCYQELRDRPLPPVELLVAPVYADERNQGRAVYFSEVVVRRDAPYADFAAAAREARWAYNDIGSLSGYHSILRRLRELDGVAANLERAVCSGSHLRSLAMVAAGEADAAAIDANVLALHLEHHPEAMAQLHILETLGPHPVQPVVVRVGLAAELKERLRELLLGLDANPQAAQLLARFRVRRFVPIGEAAYARTCW